MNRRTVATVMCVLSLAVALGLNGCTYVQRGAAIGAGSGALVGGVIGHQGPEGALEGALWGAGGGGILGALIGDGMTEGEPGDEIANLKNQIAALTDENARLREENQRPKTVEQPAKEPEPAQSVAEFVLAGDVLFASGSDKLTAKGQEILNGLAQKISSEYPGKALNVQGHTDNVPIGVSHWKSNWELGSARALSVVHYMIDKQGFVADNMSATTFGMYKPTKPNDTPENRYENRRAVLVVKVLD